MGNTLALSQATQTKSHIINKWEKTQVKSGELHRDIMLNVNIVLFTSVMHNAHLTPPSKH